MKISCIKAKDDENSFRFWKTIGTKVVEIEDLEQVDHKIGELIKNNYDTIILANEVASFSEDIIKKYNKDRSVSIIIAKDKE